ncbi:MAG: methylenetetrahydrofolate reductase [NAD(P)H] [Gaiellaceae bacterium]
MRIDSILATSETPVFSFEFFPPSSEEGEQNLRTALRDLAPLEPSFVSITYGAGGSSRSKTIELTRWMKQELGLEAMSHLTCVGAAVDELRTVLNEFAAGGIENVLALRGDPPRGQSEWRPTPGGLRFSSELIALIKEHYDFCVGAACFPEVHRSSPDLSHDLAALRSKQEAGADFFITQLFFDSSAYFYFVAAAREAGITRPIIPGVIPITNVAQLKRIAELGAITIPTPLVEQLEARSDDPEAVLQLGVAFATLQCAELLEGGAPGIHFYTLNRSPATRAILSALRLLRPWERTAARLASAS